MATAKRCWIASSSRLLRGCKLMGPNWRVGCSSSRIFWRPNIDANIDSSVDLRAHRCVRYRRYGSRYTETSQRDYESATTDNVLVGNCPKGSAWANGGNVLLAALQGAFDLVTM